MAIISLILLYFTGAYFCGTDVYDRLRAQRLKATRTALVCGWLWPLWMSLRALLVFFLVLGGPARPE